MTLSRRSYFALDLPILSILHSISICNNQLQSLLTYAILILGRTDCPRGASDLLPFKYIPFYCRASVRNLCTTVGRGLVRLLTIIHHRTHKHPFSINQLINNCNKIFAGCASGHGGQGREAEKSLARVTLLYIITGCKLAIPHLQVPIISSVYLLCI